MEYHLLFRLIDSCISCQSAKVSGIEELSEYFSKHIFFNPDSMPDCHSFFSQTFARYVSGRVCCITDSFLLYTCVVTLTDNEYLILGPYLLEKPTDTFITDICAKNRIPLSLIPALRHFYNRPPILNHQRIYSIADILLQYAGISIRPDFLIYQINNPEPAEENYFQMQEEHLEAYSDMLERKYQNDMELCRDLMAGNLEACSRHMAEKNLTFTPLNSQKEDFFNQLIYNYTFNILYRIISYAAGVPAIYIQKLQDTWNHRINNSHSLASFNSYKPDMLSSYCLLIRKKSYLQHSAYVKSALAYIDTHISIPLSVKTLAAHVHISEGHLQRLFRKEVGETITDYINHQRIRLSLPMLQKKNTQIQNVCICVGIEDPNYYARLFKKYMGISPTEYQKKQLL